MSESRDYALGYSEHEARRLQEQAAMLEEFTADTLRRAGLRPGMRVLDMGSGLGDVSLVASRIVGQDGAVLGIDRDSTSVETATRRAASAAVANVSFVQADLATFEMEQTFDAIIGRFVLLYLRDPAAILRRLSRGLRPGGVVAFQELDMSQISQTPASELFLQTRRWVLDAFVAGGAEVDMGTKLYSTFLRAGLPAPYMFATSLVMAGPYTQGYMQLVQVLRSLLPVVERSGIAKLEEIGIETLARRLIDDATANERVGFASRLIGAWSIAT
jgi:2-polyprenyl-3-methyl-5-hydroxy-6-metoxy-1,4-benzoquinol methylase